jgi:hypothetical protein
VNNCIRLFKHFVVPEAHDFESGCIQSLGSGFIMRRILYMLGKPIPTLALPLKGREFIGGANDVG